jgi:hypothetical protein
MAPAIDGNGSVVGFHLAGLLGIASGGVPGFLVAIAGAAATIVQTTIFGFILWFLLIPHVPALLDRRPWWSIAMAARKFEVTNLALGAGIAIMTMVTLNPIGYLLEPDSFHFAGLDPGSWVPMRLIAAVVFTFALPHFGNVAGSSGLLMLLPYIVIGLTYGLLAWRSGSLWLGAGVHLGNNWFITMFVGNAAGEIPKVSLFTTHGTSSGVDLVVSAAIQGLVVLGLAELLMLRIRLIRSWVLAQGGS